MFCHVFISFISLEFLYLDIDATFQFRVIVTTDNDGNTIDGSSEALNGYRFNIENSDEATDYELMFNAIKLELLDRIPGFDAKYKDLKLSWDDDGYHIVIEGGNDLQVALDAMQNSSVYQFFLQIQPIGKRF